MSTSDIHLFKRVARLLSTVLVVGYMAACATAPATPEAIVRERATQAWQARIAGDLDKGYQFMPPSYRALTGLDAYKRSFGGSVQIVAAEVALVTCDSTDRCQASMKVQARPGLQSRSAGPLVTYFDETWVREGNNWWLFPTR